jgi:FkbM family methyltransferase
MHNGIVVEEHCYGGPWMTEIIRQLRGHHEPQEEVAFNAIVERLRSDTAQPVMVELGSYWAYYSLWLKAAIPGARCICVEPDPRNLEVGRRNFELNGFSGDFVNAAAGSPHGRMMRMRTESDLAMRRVRLVTLEGLMRENHVERVDVLLSDIQGAEADLLTVAQPLLRAGRVRFLVVSTHHHSISGDALTHQRCRDILRDCGAHIIVEHSVHESASGDGLIVASTDPRDRDMELEVTLVRAKDSIVGEPEYELAKAMRLSPQRLRQAIGKRVQSTLSRF